MTGIQPKESCSRIPESQKPLEKSNKITNTHYKSKTSIFILQGFLCFYLHVFISCDQLSFPAAVSFSAWASPFWSGLIESHLGFCGKGLLVNPGSTKHLRFSDKRQCSPTLCEIFHVTIVQLKLPLASNACATAVDNQWHKACSAIPSQSFTLTQAANSG